MKLSRFFCPTLKELPSEAVVVSHQIMLRSGMIRQLSAGIYDILPLGLRIIRKVEHIIRDEMNKKGALELLLPSIHPASLWMETGRWEQTGKELLRMKDRKDRDYCFAPTHEEAITDLVRREIKSHKELPKNFYQIQTKFRDEVRPRFGVMRSREFTMKDAYSFDLTDEGANRSYQDMFEAYENIFTRCGLKFVSVQADSGNIGGKLSQEFMILANSGEDRIILCKSCHYSANIEKANAYIENIQSEAPHALEKVSTLHHRTCEDVAKFLSIDLKKTIKTIVYDVDGQCVAVCLQGDRTINEIALMRLLGVHELRPATESQIINAFGSRPGSIGPVSLKSNAVRFIFDSRIGLNGSYVLGANEEGFHYKNAVAGRDFKIETQTLISEVRANDACPNCQSPLLEHKGIEVGHVFKLGAKYSKAMNACVANDQGQMVELVMGCYGIGVARTVASAIEQKHDEHGPIYAPSIAPFEVIVTCLEKEGPTFEYANSLYQKLMEEKIDVALDDRDLPPGAKFKDADLFGIPVRIVIGKKSLNGDALEIKLRWESKPHMVSKDVYLTWIKEKLNTFPI